MRHEKGYAVLVSEDTRHARRQISGDDDVGTCGEHRNVVLKTIGEHRELIHDRIEQAGDVSTGEPSTALHRVEQRLAIARQRQYPQTGRPCEFNMVFGHPKDNLVAALVERERKGHHGLHITAGAVTDDRQTHGYHGEKWVPRRCSDGLGCQGTSLRLVAMPFAGRSGGQTTRCDWTNRTPFM